MCLWLLICKVGSAVYLPKSSLAHLGRTRALSHPTQPTFDYARSGLYSDTYKARLRSRSPTRSSGSLLRWVRLLDRSCAVVGSWDYCRNRWPTWHSFLIHCQCQIRTSSETLPSVIPRALPRIISSVTCFDSRFKKRYYDWDPRFPSVRTFFLF